MIGQTLGPYRVVARLGEGGMGEVYRARDTRLDRDVALKVLPPHLTNDPERLARLEREAKVLATLNHPNIAQVYGYEATAIAMELVEGPTLEQVIRHGINLSEALAIARQIATALEVAHEHGIVHRDLKPANVKVKEDGTVKVLDFGLAKALASDRDGSVSSISDSPTLTARSTQVGMILGTAAYMAPEQAKGRAVDRRADIWAFGVVLFEMLAGRRAFDGDDVSDVLASVLKSDPDWSALPPDLPGPVRRLLRRCLEKDPKKRLRDISEGMLQMDEALAAHADSGPGQVQSSTFDVDSSAKPLWRRALPFAATAVIAGLAVWVGIHALTPTATPRAQHFRDSLPAAAPFFFSSPVVDLALSPDAQTLVYQATDGRRPPNLYARRFDQDEPQPIRGAENAIGPFISPDGRWVGFIDYVDWRQLKKVPVSGGSPTVVARLPNQVYGAAWTHDGVIVTGRQDGGLMEVPENGGTPAALTELGPNETDHAWPSAIPGTSLVLFMANASRSQPLIGGELAVVDRATRAVVRLKVPGTQPRYVAGHIIYGSPDGSLRGVPFDPAGVRLTGDAVVFDERVNIKTSGAANFSVTASGHFVHAPGQSGGPARTLVWVDRGGSETPIPAPPRQYFYARLSPRADLVSLDIRDEEQDIWVWDLKAGTLRRLTDQPGNDQYGLWTPDGRIVFSGGATSTRRAELYLHRHDGVGEMRQLTDTAADNKSVPFPNAITPDGKSVIFRMGSGHVGNDLYVADITGDKSYRKLVATEHDELNASLSPDGRFMVFMSNRSGRNEIVIRPFPNVNDGEWSVSAAESGGTEPAWGGNEVFYLSADSKLMAVAIDRVTGKPIGPRQELFDASKYFFGGIGRNYDVTRDGKRFVMVKDPGVGENVPIMIVFNWAERLKAK